MRSHFLFLHSSEHKENNTQFQTTGAVTAMMAQQ